MIHMKGMLPELGTYRGLCARTKELMGYTPRAGRKHAPALSISDDMPEAGGGACTGAAEGADAESSDDDDAGDGDGDPDPARRHSRPTHSPVFLPALLGFAPLSHYVGFGRSRIYQLINAGEFPPPIKIGKSSRWIRAEIDQWLSSRIAERSTNKGAR